MHDKDRSVAFIFFKSNIYIFVVYAAAIRDTISNLSVMVYSHSEIQELITTIMLFINDLH